VWIQFGGRPTFTPPSQREFLSQTIDRSNSAKLPCSEKQIHREFLADLKRVDMDALSTLSPYRTEYINRIGNYVINPDRIPEPLEEHLDLSLSPVSA
jgi:hypothetical protein